MSSVDADKSVVPLWRNRDFVLLWTGQVVSALGTRITSIAYPLLVLSLTGSPAKAGIVGFAQALPFLVLYLPAGALVDRWDRKRTMVINDVVRGVALGTIVVALAVDRLTFPHLVVVAFVEGSMFVFFTLAESAALPRIVPQSQLPTAVAQNEARLYAAEIVGLPLGGLLFAVARALPFLFDTVSYALSAVSLLFIRGRLQEDRAEPRRRLATEVAEGVRWLWHQPFLRTAVVLIAGVNFAFNALNLVIIVRARDLGASPGMVGLILGLLGVGGLVGALVAPAVTRRLRPRTVLVGSIWLWTATTAGFALVGEPLLLGVVAALSGLVGPSFNVVITSYRYSLVPDRLQARVQSVARMVAWGTIPLGALSAGLLVEAFDAPATIWILAAVMATVSIATVTAPSFRHLPPLDSLSSPT